jgi:hypothetical protein
MPRTGTRVASRVRRMPWSTSRVSRDGAYGRTHPDLGRLLDPFLDDIGRQLRRLAYLADQLPDV